MRRFSRYIQAALPAPVIEEQLLDPELRWFYHGISVQETGPADVLPRAQGIAQNGLQPRGESGFSNTDKWGDLYESRATAVYLYNAQSGFRYMNPMVRVDITQLDPSRFILDEDWLHEKYDFDVQEMPLVDMVDRDYPDEIEDPQEILTSLMRRGTVAYEGSIPTEILEFNTVWLQRQIDSCYDHEREDLIPAYEALIDAPWGGWFGADYERAPYGIRKEPHPSEFRPVFQEKP